MKDWTIQQAQTAQSDFQAKGGTSDDPAGPLFQWVAVQKLEWYQEMYDDGRYPFALMHALFECAMHDLTLPEWVRKGFIDRYRLLTHGKVKETDEAFGRYLSKGAKLPAVANRRKAVPVYEEVRRRHAAGESISPALFESVGEQYAVSGSLAKAWYYEWNKILSTEPPK